MTFGGKGKGVEIEGLLARDMALGAELWIMVPVEILTSLH